MKLILINISLIVIVCLNGVLGQIIGNVRVNAHEIDKKKQTENKIDSLHFTIINLNTKDTLYNGIYQLEFKNNLEIGNYLILANFKNYTQIEENFIVSGDKITFIDLRFKTPKSAKGNYLMVSPWSISFIKLNKKNEVKWYTEGCTDRGTKHIGTWAQHNDTISIKLDEEVKTFLLINNILCHLNDEEELTEVNSGMAKTKIQSKWRVHLRAKKIRRRKKE